MCDKVRFRNSNERVNASEMQCRNIECEDDQGGGKEEVGDNPVNGIVGRSGCEVRLGKVNLCRKKKAIL